MIGTLNLVIPCKSKLRILPEGSEKLETTRGDRMIDGSGFEKSGADIEFSVVL